MRVTSASQKLLIVVPAGRSNSTRQVLTVASVPLVTVTRTSWPLPQSDVRVKVVVTLPAPNALATGTATRATSAATPAQRNRRTEVCIRRLLNLDVIS